MARTTHEEWLKREAARAKRSAEVRSKLKVTPSQRVPRKPIQHALLKQDWVDAVMEELTEACEDGGFLEYVDIEEHFRSKVSGQVGWEAMIHPAAVSAVLRVNGWYKHRFREDGERFSGWFPPSEG